MAEIANSDSPSPYASSTPEPFSDDAPAQLNDFPSDVSSILDDTDVEEEDEDDDISIDQEEEDEEEEDEDEDEEEDEEEEDDPDEVGHGIDQDYYDDDFDGFDFDMRDVDLDFDGFGFLNDEQLRPGDYLDFPDDEQIDALHHAFLHELEHHFAQEQWALRPHSPVMDQAQGGAGGRARMQRGQLDQLVRVEMVGHGNGNGGNGGGAGNGAGAATGGQRRARQQLPNNVIDLTGDDDAEMPGQSNPAGPFNQPARSVPHRQSENQRRLRSQPQNAPPRLNRSDGSYIDDQHIIVLSSSDDEDRPLRNVPRRGVHNNRHNHPDIQNIRNAHFSRYHENNLADRGARNARFGDQLRQPGLAASPAPAQAQGPNPNGRLNPFTQLMQNIPILQYLSNPATGIMANRNQNPDDDIVITGERNVGNVPNIPNAVPVANPHQFLGLQLDYAARPFHVPPPAPNLGGLGGGLGGGGPPKPAHEAPGPARPGFTRDTGEDVVAICPSCDQELAYDPEGDDDPPPTPAKKSRSKKATAEHHFWAVKACGHVYCKRCFENRRPSAKSGIHVGFRPEGNGGKKLYCAVEDCDSEISTKGSWVGIFM
ncbi:hypothetical protein GGS24DRAFT_210749 [Hypoxylon argillaceum]|nr:hypothetical protein GGS24DRAFT_210749 [Hypoxylon argillaceum]